MPTHVRSPVTSGPQVGLLVTCLVDLFRPSVGFAAVKLLERVGCRVMVPGGQTCCGQPAYNSGDFTHSRVIAKQVLTAFAKFDYVVAPSGSCAAMLKCHYPKLLADEPKWRDRAQSLAERTFELVSFLTDVMGLEDIEASLQGRVTYHDACSGLRELGIRAQPRQLLARVQGLELVEMQHTESCCGFGGTFCVKYPEISIQMVSKKVDDIRGSRACTLLGGDLGCLLNIAGRLRRLGETVAVYHVAEVLADMADGSGIGDPVSRA